MANYSWFLSSDDNQTKTNTTHSATWIYNHGCIVVLCVHERESGSYILPYCDLMILFGFQFCWAGHFIKPWLGNKILGNLFPLGLYQAAVTTLPTHWHDFGLNHITFLCIFATWTMKYTWNQSFMFLKASSSELLRTYTDRIIQCVLCDLHVKPDNFVTSWWFSARKSNYILATSIIIPFH